MHAPMKHLIVLAFSCSALFACSASDKEPRNLAESQKRAMEKAEAVEAQLQDAAEQRAEQADQ